MRAVLTWHSVDRSGSVISVTPEALETQLAWLERSGTKVLPLADLLANSCGGPAVALTFDDGFANFSSEVVPALQRRGWPATLFVVSGHVGGVNAWSEGHGRRGVPQLPLIDWAALRALPADLVEIGAHSRSHRRLDRIVEEHGLEAELRGCAEDLADQLGRWPDAFAYPYGASSPMARRVAARHFRWSFGTEFRGLGPLDDPHDLPRIDAWYLRRPALYGPWASLRCQTLLRVRGAARRTRHRLTGPAQ